MSAFTSLDDYVSCLAGANTEQLFFYKDQFLAGVAQTAIANKFNSYWRFSGFPGPGVAPGGTVRIPTRATAGALGQSNPGGGRQKWLVGGAMAETGAGGIVMLYDRLLDISGFSGTNTGAQTVGGSMTRYTSNSASVGNMIFVEIYTTVGASTTTITASYTNQAGTSGQVTQATTFGNTGFREANIMLPLQLASGDTGVQAVASVTVLATTGTAGDFGVTVARPLLMYGPNCGVASAAIANYDWITSGAPPEVLTDACLALAFMNSTTAPRIVGNLNFVER